MDPVVLLLSLAAVALGIAIGWAAFGRGAGAAMRERDQWRDKFGQAIADLAGAEARAGQAAALGTSLDQVRGERDGARETLAALQAGLAEREKAFAAQLEQIGLAKEALSAQFGEVGAKLLETAQRQFLERADQRFHQAGERSEAQLKALLQPVSETLTRHREEVARIERERTEAYGNLTGLLDAMRTGQEAVRGEAAKLVNALRAAPKARGRWGEQQLKNVLETCGLSEHTDFMTEVSVDTEDGRLRPDAVIRMPGGRSLVVDAKVSLNAYQDAHGAIDEAERTRHLSLHAGSMKAHVTGLGAKGYAQQFADAPDYVVMFVPGEHFLSAALEHDPTLWDYAFARRVLMATPTNLIAIAQTISAVWRQEKVAKQAQAVAALGKEMHDRLTVAAGKLRTVGGGLTSAVRNYNEFVDSFEKRLMVTGRKFAELDVDTGGRELGELPPVEALPRYGEAAE